MRSQGSPDAHGTRVVPYSAPAQKDGLFDLTMRIYWPKADALDGSWDPPSVERGRPLFGQN